MRRRSSSALIVACAAMTFVAVLAFRSSPADPAAEARLSQRYRLADLIESQQRVTEALRRDVERLRAGIDAERQAAASRSGTVERRTDELEDVALLAGIAPVRGAALRVTLDDSSLEKPPEGGSVNDLVIHSQDVQAVVNALWRAGAEAVAINGERLVGTSAVLCVGNTLLLNGTVHSPPYVMTAIGASRDRFEADRLVRRLRADAEAFSLTFSLERVDAAELPGYTGPTKLTYAKPIT